jgi:glucosamine 6-phosphate synthetase-like amidotransferase/phosphosugar isomerase protein
MRLILRELCTDTQSVQILWRTHAEHSVNTQEHMWIHDTQSDERADTLKTLADKKPNQASFGY